MFWGRKTGTQNFVSIFLIYYSSQKLQKKISVVIKEQSIF